MKAWPWPAFGLIAGSAAWARFQFQVVEREVVERRLQSYQGNDSQREAALKAMFEASGCRGDKLTEQPVKGLKQPNLICVLSGSERVSEAGAYSRS